MKTTQENQIAGFDWLNGMPTGWHFAALKRLLSEPLKYGATESGDCNDQSLPRYLRITDFDNDGKLRTDTYASLPEEIARNFALKEDDVLFARSGATVGKTFFFRNYQGQACFAGYLIKASTMRHRLAPEFLYFFTKSNAYEAWKDFIFTQATIQNIGADKYSYLPIPLPPLPEQHRIATYLDASCAAIDAAIVAKRRQIETLGALRKSMILSAVTKGIKHAVSSKLSGVEWFGDIPNHWYCQHLKRVTVRIQAGVTPPTDTPEYYEEGTIPWFAPGSFEGGLELREPRKLVNTLALTNGVLRMYPTQTVFLIGIGATIGKIGIITEPASCNQQIIGIVSGHSLFGRFLAYQMKIYEDVIPNIAVATTLPIFDQVKTGYLPILIPPLCEQEEICDFLDKKLAELNAIVVTINEQIQTLTNYRKSLIHECVTGQRRITEADLNRVKAHG